MKRASVILAFLVFALPVWVAGQQALDKVTKLEVVSRQRLADSQKFHAAVQILTQERDSYDPAASLSVIDEAQMAEASEGALWQSQSQFATGAMGIFNIEPAYGEILKFFSPPPDDPKDMAYDGEFIWCIDYLDNAIYKLDPNTGKILESIPAPNGISSGLTWDGENFWVSSSSWG